jgi:hypothetical protein
MTNVECGHSRVHEERGTLVCEDCWATTDADGTWRNNDPGVDHAPHMRAELYQAREEANTSVLRVLDLEQENARLRGTLKRIALREPLDYEACAGLAEAALTRGPAPTS